VAAEVVAQAPAEAVAAEKPKRARRTKKAAEPAVEAEAAAEAPVEAVAEAAPKPKSRARKPKAAPVEAEALAAEAPAAEAVPAEAAPVEAAPVVSASVEAPVAEEDRPRRAKKELPADEIVVVSTTATEDAPKPKKAGWWQRGFLG
jgi:ribonuclease E